MPKKSVFECSCDRCGRVWYEEVLSKEELDSGKKQVAGGSFHLELRMPDGKVTKVIYELMCETCSTAVANYTSNIARDLKTVSKAKKKEPEAPPPPPSKHKK